MGCRSCGYLKRVKSSGDGCENCDPYHYVDASRGGGCVSCGPGHYFALLSTGGEGDDVWGCKPCPVGFYRSDATHGASPRCKPCEAGHAQNHSGQAYCVLCASGTFPNAAKTACVPCSLNVTQRPYVRYQNGTGRCMLECDTTRAWQAGANADTADGCRSCAALVAPVGYYQRAGHCNTMDPCWNKPGINSTYTSGAVWPSPLCNWTCALGFRWHNQKCEACWSPLFNGSIHAWTEGGNCTFGCLPGRYAPLNCTVACVELDTTLRVRDLPTRGRIAYDVSPSNCSRMSAVRLLGFPMPTSVACGDGILNDGEACDDGNTRALDGCDQWCQLEKGSLRDCDLIGQECLCGATVAGRCMCGWPLTGGSSWDTGITGFLLPSSTVCTNYTYYDYLQQPMQQRAEWMHQNLKSCSCTTEPSRQLTYAECVEQQMACRACSPWREYHDDARRECVTCGSVCEPGFTAGTSCSSAENASTSRSAALWSASRWEEAQALLGCVRCPSREGAQYVHGCEYTCQRDASVVNNSVDYYCSEAQPSGLCGGVCHRCDASYVRLQRQIEGQAGLYIMGCSDVVGHQVASCTNRLPLHAHFVGNSLGVGNADQCQWKCDLHTHATLDGTRCIPCPPFLQQPTACQPGEMFAACWYAAAAGGVQESSHFCQSCSEVDAWKLLDANGLTRLYSDPPDWNECYEDCKDGVAWSATRLTTPYYYSNATLDCTPCSRVDACDAGYRIQACVRRNDTLCVACGVLRSGEEYVSPGIDCDTRCASGYYADASTGRCLPFADLASCWHGQTRAHQCKAPSERLAPPTCVPCPGAELALVPHQDWFGCAKVCDDEYYFVPGSGCLACNRTACAIGTKATCSKNVQRCTFCNESEILSERIIQEEDTRLEYSSHGECTQSCKEVLFLPSYA